MQVLYTETEIADALAALAPRIVADLGQSFTMIPILNGGFMFGADLARALYRADADPEVDFLQLSSYGAGRESSGEVRLLKDLNAPVEGQAVLLVDDVLDSGRSLYHARRLVTERGASRVAICVAVDKRVPRAHEVEADYALFRRDGNAFLVGYGMDDAGVRRAMPQIAELT
jgi:hypoxanthine phosphoribosyltransferase